MMNEFLDELKRVLAFYQRPDKEKQPTEYRDYEVWLEEIYKKVAWIESIKFRLVVDALLDVRPRFRKDLDHRKMLAIYNELAERNGWKRQTERNCPDCRGIRFVDVWLKDKKGVEFKAVKGCSNCNAKMAGIHADFTQIDPPDIGPIDKRANVRTIPAFMAQCLINMSESSRIPVKEDLLDDLMQAAAQPGLTTYHPGKYDAEKRKTFQYNEARRKNELVVALIAAPPVTVVEAGMVEEEPAKTEPLSAPAEQPSPAAPTVDEEVAPERVVF